MNAKTFKLAVLFADLGDGQGWQRSGLGDFSVTTLKTVSRSYRGRVVSVKAERIMACFPDTDDACMAAIGIQRSLNSETGKAARIALHSGLCLVKGSSIFGDVVDDAEALLALAGDGEIVLSEALMQDALESVTDGATQFVPASGGTLYLLPWQHQGAKRPESSRAMFTQAGQVSVAQVDREAQEAQEAQEVPEAPEARQAKKLKKRKKAKKAKQLPPKISTSAGQESNPELAAEIADDEVAIEPFHASLVDDPVLALYGLDHDIDIASNSGVFCVGRDAEMNDWIFAKPIVSRCHFQIEFREGHFVLQDCSTNGTYVTIDGQPQQHLKRSELILQGTGLISLSLKAYKDPELMMRFELREGNEFYG